MNHITFRPATIADLPILLEFEQGIVSAERPFNPTLKMEGVTYYDIAALIDEPNAEVIVGSFNGQIITSGYALIKQASSNVQHDAYALLGFMYVHPTMRGKGINKLLTEQLTNWAKAQQVFEIRLYVYAENKPAIRAYEKAGFTSLVTEMRLDLGLK